jgi:hypothetical protein
MLCTSVWRREHWPNAGDYYDVESRYRKLSLAVQTQDHLSLRIRCGCGQLHSGATPILSPAEVANEVLVPN